MKKLVIDIETSPNLVLEFDIFDSRPRSPDAILEPTRMLCFAYKWVGERGVQTVAEWDGGHEGMVAKAHELLTEADVVIHFNGKRFDVKHLNREFAEYGLGPPAPYEQIDVYQAVKSRFALPSNRLSYVSKFLRIAAKGDSGGLETWKRLREGDVKAQAQMLRYNARDVVVTEQAYKEIVAWVPGHPSEAVAVGGKKVCPVCASAKLVANGTRKTRSREYQRYQCKGCGSWSQSVKSDPASTAAITAVPL